MITGRYYIGMHSTSNLNDGYMGSGKRLRYSLRKNGIENHKKEILEFFDSRELLIEAEKQAITADMITDDNCMNLMGGGEGGFISEEQQRHRSQCANKVLINKIKTDENFRKDYCKKISIGVKKAYKNGKFKNLKRKGFLDKNHSTDSKQKIGKANSIKQLGDKNSQYGTCWITKDGENKKIKKEDLDIWLKEGWLKGRK